MSKLKQHESLKQLFVFFFFFLSRFSKAATQQRRLNGNMTTAPVDECDCDDSWIHDYFTGPLILLVIGSVITPALSQFIINHCNNLKAVREARFDDKFEFENTLIDELDLKPQTLLEWSRIKKFAKRIKESSKRQYFEAIKKAKKPTKGWEKRWEKTWHTTTKYTTVSREILQHSRENLGCNVIAIGCFGRRKLNPSIEQRVIDTLAGCANTELSRAYPFRAFNPNYFSYDLSKGYHLKYISIVEEIASWHNVEEEYNNPEEDYYPDIFLVGSQDDLPGFGRSLAPAIFYQSLLRRKTHWIDASSLKKIERYFLSIYNNSNKRKNPLYTRGDRINFGRNAIQTADLIVFQDISLENQEERNIILEHIRGLKCKIICVTTRLSEWPERARDYRNTLTPLTRRETIEYLKQKIPNLPDPIYGQLHDLSKGIPLLLELIKGIVKSTSKEDPCAEQLKIPGPLNRYIKQISSSLPRSRCSGQKRLNTFLAATLSHINIHFKVVFSAVCFCAPLEELIIPEKEVMEFIHTTFHNKKTYFLQNLIDESDAVGILVPYRISNPMIRRAILKHQKNVMYNKQMKLIDRNNSKYLIGLLSTLNTSNELIYRNLTTTTASDQLLYCETALPFIQANKEIFEPLALANFLFFTAVWKVKHDNVLGARNLFLEAQTTIKKYTLKRARDASDIIRIENGVLCSDIRCGLFNRAHDTYIKITQSLTAAPCLSPRRDLSKAGPLLIKSKVHFNASELYLLMGQKEEAKRLLTLAIYEFDQAMQHQTEHLDEQSKENYLYTIRRHTGLIEFMEGRYNAIILISHSTKMRTNGISPFIRDILHLKAIRDFMQHEREISFRTFKQVLDRSEGYSKTLAVYGMLLIENGDDKKQREGAKYLNKVLNQEPPLFSQTLFFFQEVSELANTHIKQIISAWGNAWIEPWLASILYLANNEQYRTACYTAWTHRYDVKPPLSSSSDSDDTIITFEEEPLDSERGGGSKEDRIPKRKKRNTKVATPQEAKTPEENCRIPFELKQMGTSATCDAAFALLMLHALTHKEGEIALASWHCIASPKRRNAFAQYFNAKPNGSTQTEFHNRTPIGRLKSLLKSRMEPGNKQKSASLPLRDVNFTEWLPKKT